MIGPLGNFTKYVYFQKFYQKYTSSVVHFQNIFSQSIESTFSSAKASIKWIKVCVWSSSSMYNRAKLKYYYRISEL